MIPQLYLAQSVAAPAARSLTLTRSLLSDLHLTHPKNGRDHYILGQAVAHLLPNTGRYPLHHRYCGRSNKSLCYIVSSSDSSPSHQGDDYDKSL
jgi:hypothetical protein